MFRRSIVAFIIFLMAYLTTSSESKQFMKIYQNLTKNDTSVDLHQNFNKPTKRHLDSFDDFDFNQMFVRHQIPEEAKQMMADMQMRQKQMMSNMRNDIQTLNFHDLNNGMMQIDIDMRNLFDQHELPDEVKDTMRGMRGSFDQFHKDYKHGHGHHSEEHMPRGHHGPAVMSTRGHGHREHHKSAWPQMCPVMLFFIIASIFQICHLKYLEKAQNDMELFQRVNKLEEKKKEQEPVQNFVVAPPTAEVQPIVVQKKVCKKKVKLQQQAVIADVEAVPNQVNESFDYSVSSEYDQFMQNPTESSKISVQNSMI